MVDNDVEQREKEALKKIILTSKRNKKEKNTINNKTITI